MFRGLLLKLDQLIKINSNFPTNVNGISFDIKINIHEQPNLFDIYNGEIVITKSNYLELTRNVFRSYNFCRSKIMQRKSSWMWSDFFYLYV